MQAKQLAQKRAGAFYTESSTIIASMPRGSRFDSNTKEAAPKETMLWYWTKRNNIKILISIDFFPTLILLLRCWFCLQYFFKERHFKCPLFSLQHSWLAPSHILGNLTPIFAGESSYVWPYLLCWPFLMGMLCVFVGKVLELFWKSDAGGEKVSQLLILCMQKHVTEVM